MTGVDLLALAFAARACLDVWLDEDSILAERRARTQLWASEFWKDLFNCRFCLSHWVPAGLLLIFYLASLFLPAPWDVVVKLPVYALAATGLVRVIDRAVKESGGASTKDDDVGNANDDPADAE